MLCPGTGNIGVNHAGWEGLRQNKKLRSAAVLVAAAVKNETINAKSEFE
jgi:hypothetical protein